MSTERTPSTRAQRRELRRGVRFRRTSIAVIAVLAVAGLALGAASVAQGPRLRSTTADASALLTRNDQQVTLTTNQPLARAVTVSITPRVPAEASVQGTRVVVRIARPLDYATRYSIVARVSSAQTGASATLSAALVTPDITVYGLQRSSDGSGDDRLLGAPVRGPAKPRVVFSAPHILDYAESSGTIAVLASRSRTGDAELRVLRGGTTRSIPLPSGVQSRLEVSELQQIGWIQTTGSRKDGSVYDDNLFVAPATGSRSPKEVTGFSGKPLSVLDWLFVPGTTSVVVQGLDQQVYLLDTATGADPTPLGRHTDIRGFLPGTLELVAAETDGTLTLIDLAGGGKQRVTPPAPRTPAGAYPGQPRLLDRRTALIQVDSYTPSATSLTRSSSLLEAGGSGSRAVVPATADGSWINRFCLAPDARYVAVELVAASGRIIDAPGQPMFSDSGIRIVDLATGRTVRTLSGGAPSWCG